MDARLIGILGTVISALVAAFSYYAKTRHERRRASRTVLFYLLEWHHLLSSIHFGFRRFPEEYISRCKSMLANKGIVLSDSDSAKLTDALSQLLRQLGTSKMEALASEISEPFDKALTELSREDPVLAFELRGKDSIAKASKMIRTLSATSESALNENGISPVATPQLLDDLDDFGQEIAIEELSRCIRSVAWTCDVLTHFRVHRLLRRVTREQLLNSIGPRESLAIEKLLSKAIDSLNPETS